MGDTKDARKSRRWSIALSLGAVLGVVMLLLSAVPAQQGALTARAVGEGDSGVTAAVAVGVNDLYINQTELAHGLGQLAPYVPIYVTLNNTTVHKLPWSSLSLGAGFYAWATFNATIKIGGDPKNLLTFNNVTSANHTGLVTWSNGLTVSVAHQYWVNAIQYLYVDYKWTLAGPDVAVTANQPSAVLVNQTRPGHVVDWLNTSEAFVGGVLTLAIPANWSFTLQLPKTFGGNTSTPQYGETVTATYTFTTQVRSSPVAKTIPYANVTVIGPGTEGWSNYTATYAESNTSSYTSAGTFYAYTLSFLGFFVTYWWLAIVVVLAIAVIAMVAGSGSRRSRRRQ